jgi:FK506-binding nuclear protein
MSFWGVQIRPEEPYTEPEPEGTKLRVTHATLGLESKGRERTVVKCEVGERPEVLLCSLVPGVSESTSLDLLFDEEVVFTVSGNASVHLTGYYEPHEDQYNSGAADDYDSEEEDGYEFSDEDVDDEDLMEEDEFGDFEDTDDVFPVRSSVRIEEVNEEQPVAAANGANKHLKAITDGSESKKRKKDDVSKNEANESAVTSTIKDADENRSEDEDGFALPGKNKKAVHSLEQSPSKSPTVTRMGVTPTPLKTTGDVETPAEGKKIKKKKQKAAKAQASKEQITKTSELKADGDIQELAAASKVADKTPAKKMTEKRVDTKQGTVEKPRKETSGEVVQPTAPTKVAAKAQPKTPVEKRVDAEQVTVEKPSKKEGSTMKKYPNGLEIENIAMGKPDGKQAKPGKRVFSTVPPL